MCLQSLLGMELRVATISGIVSFVYGLPLPSMYGISLDPTGLDSTATCTVWPGIKMPFKMPIKTPINSPDDVVHGSAAMSVGLGHKLWGTG
jgi:hypothetical protein